MQFGRVCRQVRRVVVVVVAAVVVVVVVGQQTHQRVVHPNWPRRVLGSVAYLVTVDFLLMTNRWARR